MNIDNDNEIRATRKSRPQFLIFNIHIAFFEKTIF